MIPTSTSELPEMRHVARLVISGVLLVIFLNPVVFAEGDTSPQKQTFPDTASLFTAVIQREKEADLELGTLVFKDDVVESEVDGKGRLRTTRTETHYFRASAYDPFALHITTNGRSLNIPILEILEKSRLVARQWSEPVGRPTIAFSFEPQSPVAKHGDLETRIAGDLKGTVWISPSDASIVRFEFQTVVPILLGQGFLGRIDSLEGLLQMQDSGGGFWLPARQEFLTQGKNTVGIVVGVRISKKFRTRQIDELSRYAPAFDMVQAQPSMLVNGN